MSYPTTPTGNTAAILVPQRTRPQGQHRDDSPGSDRQTGYRRWLSTILRVLSPSRLLIPPRYRPLEYVNSVTLFQCSPNSRSLSHAILVSHKSNIFSARETFTLLVPLNSPFLSPTLLLNSSHLSFPFHLDCPSHSQFSFDVLHSVPTMFTSHFM